MDDLFKLIQTVSQAVEDSGDKEIEDAKEAVVNYLDSVDEIRILVARSRNFGHQASSVNVLRALINDWELYGDQPRYTVCLYCDDVDCDDQVEKMKLLLPQFQNLGEEFDLYGASVTVILLKADTKLEQAPFGISGGWDDQEQDIENALDRLNVEWYLGLQPYAWHEGKNIAYDWIGRVRYDLDDTYHADLAKRAFYLDPPEVTDDDWKAIAASDYAVKGTIIKLLLDSLDPPKIELVPIYGVNTLSYGQYPLINFVSALIGRQDEYKSSLPIVALELQTIPEENWDSFVELLGDPDGEDFPDDDTSADFRLWSRTVKLSERVKLLGSPGGAALTLDQVTQAIDALEKNQILVLYLPEIPMVLFNMLYGQASLPPVFEGQNTAELMINLGRPYYKYSQGIDDVRFGYPTLPIQRATEDPQALVADGMARSLFRVRALDWTNDPNDASNYPPRALMPMIDAFLNAKLQPRLAKYFAKLPGFFHEQLEGKLFWGLDLLVNQVMQAKDDERLAAARAGMGALDPVQAGPVEQLYDALVANTQGGTLPFLRAVTSGLTYDLFSQVMQAIGLDPLFTITNAQPVLSPDKTKATLTGSTVAFGLGTTSVSFVFTLPPGLILPTVADLRAQFDAVLSQATLSMPGAQWLSAGVPAVGLTLESSAAVPVSGAFRMDVTAGFTATMSIRVPIAPGIVDFQATFTEPRPSITNIFQMVAGINLQALLPSQLQLLTDIEVLDLELQYDYANNVMSSIGVNLGTPPGHTWDLVPAVTVNQLTFSATVSLPGDLKQRSTAYQIGAQFGIGQGTLAINARLPNLNVVGGLTPDSKPILVGDVLKQYLGDLPVPSQIAGAQIDKLFFSVDKPLGAYAFTMDVTVPWQIPFTGTPLFTIDELGLDISATSRAIDSASGGDAGQTKIRGTFTGTTTILPQSLAIGLAVSATYDSATGWTFEGRQLGNPIPIGDLLQTYLGWNTGGEYQLDGLDLMVRSGSSATAWRFSGSARNWTVPFISGLSVDANVTIADDEQGMRGRIETDWKWSGVDLKIWFDFNPQVNSFGITWDALEASVTGPDPKTGDYVAALRFTDSFTIGSLVEEMVSWITGARFSLDPPWDLLDKISLSGLALTYTFNPNDATRNKVGLQIGIGPIDLVFARIDGIQISYESKSGDPNAKGVMVTLTGSFPWNSGDGALGDSGNLGPWDAAVPGSAPAPPGNGNRYFDLRTLAMGQHVGVPCLRTADTVQAAIACLNQLPDTKDGKVPAIHFDAGSAWLVGTDFGVLQSADQKTYLLALQVVFNDPILYGLRLKLDGDAAKIFKGLDFQVMYRQISDTVGVYQAEITLPDAMRNLSIGAYSITLPVFGIQVYTNGDFLIDVGFPWNQDFTRSFTVQGIIYPGIPVLGSAGFYFGKLSSATTTRVPQATNGTFNPVIVFGFGLQIGFGKWVQYGPLSAGFSVTAVGIIEGVIAKWNPYALSDGGDTSQLQTAYYFWLRGTVGVIGKLFGSIDFAIVKADVNVEIQLLLQLTYESYVSISISVIASVSVSITVKIDLGLFSIKIHCSFSARIKETFTMDNSGTPPWRVDGATARGVLRGPAERRLRAARELAAKRAAAKTAAADPVWTNLVKPATPIPLGGYAATALTVAADEWTSPPVAQDQVPCYVAMLLIDSVPPASVDRVSSARKAAGQVADTSFEILCKMVFRWLVAALQDRPYTAEELDGIPVHDSQLVRLLEEVLDSTDDNPTPLPPDVIDADFLSGRFAFTVGPPPASAGESDSTFFPVPGALALTLPPYGDGYPGYAYTFGAYNGVSAATLQELRAYFDQLAVQVESESGGQPRAAAPPESTMSLATWLFSDYFLLVGRQMVQAARDALRDFKYPIGAGQTPNDVITWINQNGQFDPGEAYTLTDLVTANATHPLTAGKPVTSGTTYTNTAAQPCSLRDAATALGAPTTADTLAAVNAAAPGFLQAGVTIHLGAASHTVQAGDTLVSIAGALGALFQGLLIASDALDAAIVAPGGTLLVPAASYRVQSGDTFQSIAALAVYGGGFTAAALASQSAGATVIQPGTKITYPGKDPYVVGPRDVLGDVANHLGVSFADFLAQSDALSAAGLLVPATTLALPVFAVTSGAADTVQSIASAIGVTIDVIAGQAANGTVADLFATVDSQGNPAPYLDVPHLSQFAVGEVLAEAQRSLALQQLSGMVSRYHLHGLRLPTTGITPDAMGMWVEKNGSALELPPFAGLYALTGQQFPVPLIGTTTFSITFDRSAGPAWLAFPGGASQLVLDIAPGSTDATRIANATAYARGTRVDMGTTALGAGDMVTSALATYPVTSPILWQSTGPVTLPYGTPPAAIPSLRLWALPDALVNLPDPAARAVDPRFAVRLAEYDEASGATTRTDVSYYGWATVVEFAVRRVPPDATSPASADTYEILGAGGNDVTLLERLLDQVQGNDSFFDQVILGYAPDGTSSGPGVQTDPLPGVTLGIAQVNLSTETRPGAASAVRAAAAATQGIGLLNTPSTFVRLLWEASITRNGGFYLYYYDGTDGRGLPDRIFDDKGEATVTLILLYSQPSDPLQQNRVTDFMTSIATGIAIDTANAVIYTEADPPAAPPLSIPAPPARSPAEIAYAYFTDLADLAGANAGVPLTSQKTVTVSEGTYQAPPGGIALAQIAQQFGTTVAALQAANRDWTGGLPDPLPFPGAIRLPVLDLAVGTAPHTASLGDVASFYGEDLVALATHNQDTPELFAVGQTLTILGGPRLRSAAVPPGVQALFASRPVPDPIPVDPTSPDFGRLFFQNTYSLLEYQVAENADYTASVLGLPAGPTTDSDATSGDDKIRAPRLLAPGVDTWDYSQAAPYSPFARAAQAAAPPTPGQSPYLGVGGLLQVHFAWQDYFGNTLVTTLSDPQPGDPGPFDQAPIPTGYTDAVLGLSTWPSVGASWQVTPPATAPLLTVPLTFDDSRYQGMIAASAAAATTIVARFTRPLDPASATDLGHYTLDPPVSITAAALGADGQTVTLTVAPLGTEVTYSLRAHGVTTADGLTTFDGRAGFLYPDDPAQRTSTVQANASQDLGVYTRVCYQLLDPNGVALSVQSSLVVDDAGQPVDLVFSAQQVAALVAWLFTGAAPATSIYAFLQDRAAFGTAVASPPATLPIVFTLDPSRINTAQIFELSLSLSIARTGGTVFGELESTPGIRRATTPIAAVQADLAGQGTLGLTQFAQSFQDALSQASFRLKVATGVDRGTFSSDSGATLWGVRLGLAAGQGISFSITPETRGNPAIFAPRPISPTLEGQPHVPIYGYTTGSGLSSTPTTWLDFANIDMDAWGATLFDAIDDLLTPRYTAPLQIVGHYSNGADLLGQVLQAKKDLAAIVKQWMIPVFADESAADPEQAREAFYQQLLVKLGNAYAVRAGIELQAAVTASIQGPLDEEPPRLFGEVAIVGPTLEAATVDPAALTTVDLVFSAAMDPGTSTDLANYALSGGVSALGAALSPDGTVVTLTVSKDVAPGQTTVTAAPKITDAQGRPLAPPYTRTITIGALVQAKSTITLTPPKLELSTGTRPLTFLLTAPETVKGSGGEVVSAVDLALHFDGRQIEHQIGALSGIQGYQPSTWLSFVILDADWPLAADLGEFPVPMVLRAYPATPTMAAQDGDPTYATPANVGQLTQWDYSLTYSMPFHYPQDIVYAQVEFNHQVGLVAEGIEDAFAQLAQFVTVYPAVAADFDQYLATIDATVDPIKDQQKIRNAAVAVGAFVTMVQWIIQASGAAGLVRARRPRRRFGDPSLTYSFQVEEGETPQGATQEALYVTVVGAPPEGIGAPIVRISDADYAPVLVTSAPDRFGYVFQKRGAPDQYLSAADGQAIADRTIVLPGIDLFQRQDAWSTVYLKRNEWLVPARRTADPFVYRTPDVQFAAPLLPTIDSSVEFRIQDIGAPSGGPPVTRSLADHLTALFGQLLAANTQPTLTIQVEATYDYCLNASLTPITLSITMQAPLVIDVTPSGTAAAGGPSEKLADMVATWAAAIQGWFTFYVPTGGGALWFDLAIMSNLTAQPMPLLRARRLRLDTQYVQPPLSTRQPAPFLAAQSGRRRG